jgi:proteasome accessory factor B
MAGEALERLGSLVALLTTTPRPLSLDEIVRRVTGYPEGGEARRKQFQRDKALLAAEGIVVTESEDRYRILPEHYYLPDLGLTEDEATALEVATAAVPVLASEAAFALSAIGALGTSPGDQVLLRAQLVDLPVFPRLHAAVRDRSTLTFTYDGVERVVDPLGLLFRDGWWYLHGHDRTRGARRWYRLDRLRTDVAVGAPGTAGPRPDIDLASELAAHPWAIGGAETHEAVVAVDAVLAPQVMNELGASRQVEEHADGSVVVRLTVSHRAGFRSWVLGMLDHAEVLGPPELRDDVTSWLRAMAG